MTPTIVRPGTRPGPSRPARLGIVRITDSARSSRRTPECPTWWVLHGIALLTVGAVLAAQAVLPEGIVQTLSVLVAMLGGVALVRLWIGCNRWRLVHGEKRVSPAPFSESDEASSIQEVG